MLIFLNRRLKIHLFSLGLGSALESYCFSLFFKIIFQFTLLFFIIYNSVNLC